VSQYIITIVPVVDDEIAGAVSQTMVRIDLDEGSPTVRELTMRAPDGTGLVTGRLPYVDFNLLVRAFIPPDSGTIELPAVIPSAPVAATIRQPPRRTTTTARERGETPSPHRTGGPTSHLQAGRIYRKAPDLAELEAVYTATGTISGVAEHFEVPVHTAQGWVTRMRRKNSSADR
jgi:hypothetical protein